MSPEQEHEQAFSKYTRLTPLRFIMLIGLPASGKSTYTKDFLAARLNENWYLLHPDSLRGELCGDVSDQSQNALIFNTIVPCRIVGCKVKGENILYDATNYGRKTRKGVIAQAKAQGYIVEAHVIRTPFEECVRRNAARERVVPLHVLERMRDGWMDPEEDEGIDVIYEVPQISLDPAGATDVAYVPC
jgi:predicted kinase